MSPREYIDRIAAAVTKRSGINKATVKAVLPHVFDEIRYQLTEGSLCVPIESFGTFAVVKIPERTRTYTYKRDEPEVRTLPPKLKLKFAPTRNLRREVEARLFDPSRKSFTRHPKDPAIRKRSKMRYNPNKKVYLIDQKRYKETYAHRTSEDSSM